MTKSRSGRRAEMERWFRLRDEEQLSLRRLSERSGIPVGTLSWWSHQLRQARSDEGGFVEVQVFDRAPGAADQLPAGESELRIRHPSGLAVELRGALARSVADRLVEVIERWS